MYDDALLELPLISANFALSDVGSCERGGNFGLPARQLRLVDPDDLTEPLRGKLYFNLVPEQHLSYQRFPAIDID